GRCRRRRPPPPWAWVEARPPRVPPPTGEAVPAQPAPRQAVGSASVCSFVSTAHVSTVWSLRQYARPSRYPLPRGEGEQGFRSIENRKSKIENASSLS